MDRAAVNVTEAVERLPGWFQPIDRLLFDWLLRDQANQGVVGDLLEIGAYKGKSAVLIGSHLRAGEAFTVCDVFETPPEQVAEESAAYYQDLGRAEFERNYLSVHGALPTIIHGSSLTIGEHVPAKSCRFIHVDGSHLYDFAAADLTSARELTAHAGIVVVDDYTSEHTPGVAAAWERTDLTVLALSSAKMYACWDEPDGLVDRLLAWAEGVEGVAVDLHPIRGRTVPLLTYAAPPTFSSRVRGRLHRLIG